MKSFEERNAFKVSDDWGSMSRYEHALFVFASGYESRSIDLLKRLMDYDDVDHWTLCGFTFKKYDDIGSRPQNDIFLKNHEIECIELEARDSSKLIAIIRAELARIKLLYSSVRLVVDYSSMPRNWYCALMLECMKEDWKIDVDWWYVGGDYSNLDYPCVGYGNFDRFVGAPNVDAIEQTHIFGLGFDSIRTYGIWNYLDPQRSWCLTAAPEVDESVRNLVRSKNSEIISWSIAVTDLEMESFPKLLSTINEIVRRVSVEGDVVLVPDGPKPLVLAMSIAPVMAGGNGVFCWHVGHVKPEGYRPVDVSSTGICYPFRVVNILSE